MTYVYYLQLKAEGVRKFRVRVGWVNRAGGGAMVVVVCKKKKNQYCLNAFSPGLLFQTSL